MQRYDHPNDKDRYSPDGADGKGPMTVGDMSVVKRALTELWDVPAQHRTKLIERLGEMVQDGDADDLPRIGGLLVQMSNTNLRALELADKSDRLDKGEATDVVSWQINFRSVPRRREGDDDAPG
jgi:hypothetical protein